MKELNYPLPESVLYRNRVLTKQHLQPKHRVFRNDRFGWFGYAFLQYLYTEHSIYLLITNLVVFLHRGLYRFKKPDTGNRMMS